MQRNRFLVFCLAACAWLAQADASAQAYPTARPVRIIVGIGAGAATDLAARIIAEPLAQATGGKFVVENRPGAGGNIAMAAGAQAAPDGYTLVMGNLAVNVLNQYLYSSLNFDPVKDFEPIALVAGIPFVMSVNPSVPVNSLADLVNLAKAKPGGTDVAVATVTSRIALGLLRQVSGADMMPIMFNAPGPATTEVLSGRIPVLFDTVAGQTRALVASGKLKPIAVTTRQQSDLLPGVKTVTEQGYPAFGELLGWVVLLGPKGMPREAIAHLNAEINKVLAQPETRRRLGELGYEIRTGSPQEATDFIATERTRFGPLIKSLGLKAD